MTATVISPTPGTQIARDTPFVIELIDASSTAVLLAQFAGFRAHEVAWTGTEFTDLYARDSVALAISGGWRVTLRREGGWPAAPTFQDVPQASAVVVPEIYSSPVSGTQDYSTRHEVLFAFTEFLIGTGFFTEIRASDGSTVALGAIATAADLNNVGSHRVLRSKDGHEVAFWRRTSASAWTFLVALSPGFVTGGDATTVPTAADENALIGSRASGADFDPNIGSTEYWRFIADDSVDSQVYWGFGSFYSNFLRYGVFRFPVVPLSPDVADPDPAVYDVITNGTDAFTARDASGSWVAPSATLPGPNSLAGTFKMVPYFFHFSSSDMKGAVVHLRAAKRGGSTEKGVYETPRGHWVAEQSECYYMGETEPDLTAAGFPSSGTAYEVLPL